jgi:geranylgeranyl reductase family protein
MKVAIVGAGPIGLYCGYLLSKKGYDVNIFDKKSKIGAPVRCAGIVSPDFFRIDSDAIINTIDGANIYGLSKLKIRRKNCSIVIDRAKFENQLYEMANSEGAKILLNKEITSKDQLKGYDIIIGADGPQSTIAKMFNFPKLEIQIGYQVRCYYNKEDKNIVDVYLTKDGFFWIIPENEKICRIGLLTTNKNYYFFVNFLKKLKIKKIIEHNNGLIPLKPRDITKKDNVYLVGDAAGQVKSTTGGGLYFGLRCAKILCEHLDDYENEWRKQYGLMLKLHYMLKKLFFINYYLTLVPFLDIFLSKYGDMNNIFNFCTMRNK